MLLACVQTDVVFANVSANVERTKQWIEQCADRSAELIVMPECMLSGYAYDSREAAMANSVSVEDPLFADLAQVAERFKLHVSLGFLERAEDRLFNTSVLIGAQGIVGHYRKIHLPHLGVDRVVDRGDFPYQTHTAKTASAGDVKVGLAICYDCSVSGTNAIARFGWRGRDCTWDKLADGSTSHQRIGTCGAEYGESFVFRSCKPGWRGKWVSVLRAQLDLRSRWRGACQQPR